MSLNINGNVKKLYLNGNIKKRYVGNSLVFSDEVDYFNGGQIVPWSSYRLNRYIKSPFYI